jgi:hypothetical protein
MDMLVDADDKGYAVLPRLLLLLPFLLYSDVLVDSVHQSHLVDIAVDTAVDVVDVVDVEGTDDVGGAAVDVLVGTAEDVGDSAGTAR